MRLFRVMTSLLLICVVVPAPSAGAATLTFPGCGATFKACVQSAPIGSTIRLKTNNLVPIPADGLEINKALQIEAVPGYKPKLGRPSESAYLDFGFTTSQDTTVAFRGITFKQVFTFVEIAGPADGHRVIFENNRIENDVDSGVNGDVPFGVYFIGDSKGSIVIRNNVVDSPGTGFELTPRGGPVTVTGNNISSTDRTLSSGGIQIYAEGAGTLKTTIASNLIHDVGGCGCGSPNGILIRADDSVALQTRIVNNTISPAPPEDPGAGQVSAIAILAPFDETTATIDARLFNNSISHTHEGLYLEEDEEVVIAGDRNNTFNNIDGDTTGSYDIGTVTHEDPEYVSDTNFRLASGSPLIDAGQSCITSYPLPRGDAARRFRIAGDAVDVGGYEFDSDKRASVKGRNINGTDSPDELTGTSGVDLICGFEDDDSINGKEKDDFLIGGQGSDEVKGREGNDLIDLVDGASLDTGNGGPGNDNCLYDVGDTRIGCEA